MNAVTYSDKEGQFSALSLGLAASTICLAKAQVQELKADLEKLDLDIFDLKGSKSMAQKCFCIQ